MKITGKLTAVWTKDGDPELDEVGEENARAGLTVTFDSDEELAAFVRATPFLSSVTVTSESDEAAQ